MVHFIKEGDIFSLKGVSSYAHGCNCAGAMGKVLHYNLGIDFLLCIKNTSSCVNHMWWRHIAEWCEMI